ncbi:MAG: CpaF/VirB11 family protein [Clostridia bacterium]|nr:CpaF/VirB11 family protein [Clostridia bacterium]
MLLNNDVFIEMAKEIDNIFRDTDQYMELYKIEHTRAEREIKLYSELKNKAALGEKDAREWLINQYSILLKQIYKLDNESINKYIDFNNLQKNHVQVIFEMLLEIYDMSKLIDNYALSVCITEKDIRSICKKEEEAIKQYYDIAKKIKILAVIAYSKEYGQDIIDTLQHHNINEIGVLDKDYVYIVYKGSKIHLEFLNFSDKGVIENIQKKTTQNSPVNYDQHNISIVASKNNSSRITVAGYDITPTDEDLYYNERIFNLKKITLEEMRDTYSTINELIYQFLVLNQQGRGRHFITGSDMGVGKSTFLNAMMEKVPDNWGIGILDTQNELQSRKKYARKNIYTLIENPKRTIAECFEQMLKAARDVIYVGEITKPREVAELINASLRLNSGVGATMHSLSPFEVVTNIRNLMMRTDMYNDFQVAEADIARGLDLIIHLAKLKDGRIVVEAIVEIEYIEQNVFIEPKLEGPMRDRLSNLVNMAQQALAKYMYNKNYRYNVIMKYEREKGCWYPVNLPSEDYFEKIANYVDRKAIEEFKEFFLKEKQRVGG